MTDHPVFDPLGALPAGLTVLQASAGTGKTYALSGLAVRYVAELDVKAAELCLVSFTEAATAELRGRVRARMAEALLHLRTGAPTSDGVITAVGDCADLVELAQRADRLQAAVNDFDGATITTIHGFCSRVLASADPGSGGVPVTDGSADVAEVVNDLVLGGRGPQLVDRVRPDRVGEAVRMMLALPDAVAWLPTPPGRAAGGQASAKVMANMAEREAAALVAGLAAAARDEVIARRRRARTRTFDGLLVDTRDLLRDPNRGATVVSALRRRFRVVLIDEFQDTDSVQWEIFRRAFVTGAESSRVPGPTVVLVGDPKQSIYRFRFAELSAYLAALGVAPPHQQLSTNWRSDRPLLEALGSMFEGFEFGSPQAPFHRVESAPGHERSRLEGLGAAALQLRVVPTSADGVLKAPFARRTVRADLVDVVRDLLNGEVVIHPDGAAQRALRASDIAILCRSNADSDSVARVLGAAGVAVATSSTDSVLDSDAAMQWRLLLRALERPSHTGRARAAAIGWFLGHAPGALDTMADEQLALVFDQVRTWAGELAGHGLPGLLARARSAGVQQRLLAMAGGERDLTDLDHVAELMQSATGGRPTSPAALLGVLDGLATEGSDAAELLSRRIDRDDQAVQVLTVHRSKGLEFPVVLCPFLWTAPANRGLPHAVVDGVRQFDPSWVADVHSKWTDPIRVANRDEQAGEARRLLYVALTRARHRLVLWWAPLSSKPNQALADLLANAVHAGAAGAVPIAVDDFAPLVRRAAGHLDVVPVGAGHAAVRAVPVDAPPAPLEVGTSSFRADPSWRRWSFSGIKSRSESSGSTAHDAPVAGGADEPSDVDPADVPAAIPPADAAHEPHPLANAPGGTDFGTLVHGVFERCDFASPTLAADLTELCADALRFRRLPIAAADLAAGLLHSIEAPLGGPQGDGRLRDLVRGDRLDEVAFDLRLGELRASEVGEVLAHHLPDHDLLAPWARRTASAGFDFRVAGMLNGSIDLVARTADGRQFWLADYKTNQLGAGSRYSPAELAAAMAHHHYPLQAALYLVALHRYLRWRLPDYLPDQHLAGAAYLFVRGMRPASSGHDAAGVFWWRPPTAAIEALDRLLAGGGVS